MYDVHLQEVVSRFETTTFPNIKINLFMSNHFQLINLPLRKKEAPFLKNGVSYFPKRYFVN